MAGRWGLDMRLEGALPTGWRGFWEEWAFIDANLAASESFRLRIGRLRREGGIEGLISLLDGR